MRNFLRDRDAGTSGVRGVVRLRRFSPPRLTTPLAATGRHRQGEQQDADENRKENISARRDQSVSPIERISN